MLTWASGLVQQVQHPPLMLSRLKPAARSLGVASVGASCDPLIVGEGVEPHEARRQRASPRASRKIATFPLVMKVWQVNPSEPKKQTFKPIQMTLKQ